MNRIDPVHQENGSWYFWDETWAYRYGPYESKEKAREMLENYAVLLSTDMNFTKGLDNGQKES